MVKPGEKFEHGLYLQTSLIARSYCATIHRGRKDGPKVTDSISRVAQLRATSGWIPIYHCIFAIKVT